MEMATTTTATTTATTTLVEHGESIIEESAAVNDCSCSGGGGERRRQLHCNTESPLNIMQSSEGDQVNIDATYNTITEAPTPLRKHSISVDNMLDISLIVNLREEDADILEQGVEEKRMQDVADFDSDGRRLVLFDDEVDATSLHHHGDGLLSSSDSLELEDSFDRHHANNSDGNDIIITTENNSGASPPIIRRSIHDHDSSSIMPIIAEDSSIFIIPHSTSPQDDDDPNTADKTYTTELTDDNKNITDEDYFLGIPSSSSPETQPKANNLNTTNTTTSNNNDNEIDMEALTLRITSGRSHNRSVSFDRRMIESAQFAEAVGEDPSLLLQKIIEQDSSSDFDDDDIDVGGDMLLGGAGLGLGVGVGEGEEEFLLEELQEYNAKALASIETVGSSSDVIVVREDDTAASYTNVANAATSSALSPSSVPSSSAEGTNSNNMEPKCVSTDLSRVSPKESEEVVVYNNNNNNNRLAATMERKQSFDNRKENNDDSQLVPPSNIINSTISSSAPPTTPISSPAKARISPFTSFHPPYVDWKFQRQHSSSTSLDNNNNGNNHRFHHHPTTVAQTNTNNDASDFRGIRLPEITKRGVARGNYAQLHRKAWLEVSDKHHRYGKNLRMYYKHWESLGHPYHMFFDWLDAKGEAQGMELPNLPEIPRSVLDSDTVQYIADPGISASYALDIVADPASDGSAIVIDRRKQTPVCTGKEGWIFVLRDHVFYGSQKVIAPNKVVETCATNNTNADENNNATTTTTKPRQRFHHSSFFGGKAVASAGIFLTDDQGHLTHLYPHSGHYRPGEAHVQRVLFFMQQLGVELSTFVVDMQQLFKVSRKFAPKGGIGNDNAAAMVVVDKEKHTSGVPVVGNKQPTVVPQQQQQQQIMKKAKKTDCLHLMCGLETACFLAHKALMIERGVFHQIHKIRRIAPDSRSVCNILNHVN